MNNYIILYQTGQFPNNLSLNSWKQYCDKYNIKLIYLTDIINPKFDRINQIFYIFEVFKQNNISYDNICLVSDTTLINKKTNNIFELTNNKLTFAEWDGDFGYLFNNIELYQSHFKKENLDFTRFFDLGFFIVQRQHGPIFNNILQFLTANYEKIKTQLDTTFIPQNFFFDCEYNKLPYTYNMIDMNRKEIVIDNNLSKLGYIYNFMLSSDFMTTASNLL
jgi:hypothetical protein